MKKIIYSLVIMIAAGSLFTSCVENTEPQGIKDLRLAKADYLDALSNLRAADAEKVKAEAALVQAQAATEQARAALKQAYVKAKELANEAQKVQDEVAAAKAKADIDSIIAKAEQDAVDAQKTLAKKQANLESTLRKIAAESIGLTQDEMDAISEATGNLNIAYGNYNWALAGVNAAQYALWNAEYDAAAGVVGYETAESYQDSIAAEEEVISLKKASIATLEAIKLAPEFAKDSIEANNAKIKELEGEKLAAESEKTLYEATTLYEANKAYVKKVEAFKNDSLKGYVEKFKFADAEGKARVYTMNDVYEAENRVDRLFKNAAAPLENEYGLTVTIDKKGVSKFVMPVADDDTTAKILYDNVKKDTLGLDGIVAALKRDLVLVNNNEDSTKAADAAKAAHDADSVYTAHRAILEKGLNEWQPYKDSSAEKKTRTENVTAAEKDSAAAYKVVVDDTVAIVKDVKAAAKEYIAAVSEFKKQVNYLKGVTSKDNDDTTAFVAAVVGLGKAQAAYFGEQDSLVLYKSNEYGEAKAYKVPFSELTKDGFVVFKKDENNKEASLYGGIGYGVFAKAATSPYYSKAFYTPGNYNEESVDAFTRVVREVVADYKWAADITVDQVAKDLKPAFTYDPESEIAYGYVADTIYWGKNYAKGVKGAYDQLENDKKALVEAKRLLDSTRTDAQNYNGDVQAKDKYGDIVKSFYGKSSVAEADYKANKFAWTAETFEDPYLCVWFENNYANIADDPTLKVILAAIDPTATIQTSWIFKRENWTEYALKLQTAQKAYIASHYTEILDQLANIEAAVKLAEEDFTTAYAAWVEQSDKYEDVLARLYGVNAKGKLNDPVEELVPDCDWPKGGYQKAWADELAPEYPVLVKAVTDKTTKLNEAIAAIRELNIALNEVAVELAKFADTEHVTDWTWTVGQIIAKVDWRIEKINKDIEFCEGEIARFAKAVAKCEAGYSPAEVKIEFYEGSLAAWENLLEQAEFELAIAKKAYDEVIAKYGVAE